MFLSHVTENTKHRLAGNNTEIVLIPLRYPLDASPNKPFKDHTREQYNNWMMSGEKSYKKGGAASLDVLYDFVIKSWHNGFNLYQFQSIFLYPSLDFGCLFYVSTIVLSAEIYGMFRALFPAWIWLSLSVRGG